MKRFETACWKTAWWEKPSTRKFLKIVWVGFGSQKKGSGRVAGTHQGLVRVFKVSGSIGQSAPGGPGGQCDQGGQH